MKELTKKEIDFIENYCDRTGTKFSSIMAFLLIYKNEYKE